MRGQARRVEWIPIREISVANPRTRNKIVFQMITANMGKVGIKKPITVCPREPREDGTRYDLACGQGRIEAIAALGGDHVPAIVVDVPAEERHLMSLVENVARLRPSNADLVREVRALLARGYNAAAIGKKLGLHQTYINDVVRLVKKGEDKLIARVEAGGLPIKVALKIALASDQEVQRALNEAYESGALRGAKFHTAQALIARRFARAGDSVEQRKRVTGKDVVRAYEQQTARHRTLIRRADLIEQRLAMLVSAMKRLREDDHFVTLLRAEGLEKIPEALLERNSENR